MLICRPWQNVSSLFISASAKMQLFCNIMDHILCTVLVLWQVEAKSEVERLRHELQITLSMYNRTCEELVYAKKKV